jgi:hypothetical protein
LFGLGLNSLVVTAGVGVLLLQLHSWNSEVFAAITGLIGTVMGIFVGQKT